MLRTLTYVDTPATSDALVGQLLDGRYLVGAKIARGGMATVYEATDLRLDRLVALKVMPQALADDETFRQRFVREARAAARLTHPNVVAVYDQGEDRGVLFLAMEYVAGRHTLRDVIRADAPLSPTRALSVLEEILKAIQAAHEAGIVHRDIKPENVLIDPRGQIKVADFGLARAISSATTATATGGVLMGTVSYLPPELVTDGSSDARSDVYALGVLLFELLTGTKPHVGDNPIQVAYKHVHLDVPPPSSLQEGIPPYVDALVARATSRERDLRPADGHVMLQQLRRVRHALDNGVIDDQELTDDLTPTVVVSRVSSPSLTPVAQPPRLAPSQKVSGFANPQPSQDEVFDFAAYDDFPTDVRGAENRPVGAERTLLVGEARPTPLPIPHQSPPGVGQPDPPTTPTGASAHPPTRRRRKRGWIAFVVVVLLAAGAAAAGWYYGVGRFQATPDVINLSQHEAALKIQRQGLTFDVAQTAFSEKVAPGAVISTDPLPGGNVVKNGTVTAVISKGPERHDVPEVAGLSASAATAAITGESLSVGKTTREWSETVPEGDVITVSPEAGVELRRDDPVAIVVSLGPKPIKIVDYTGQSADTAERELEALEFVVTRKEHYDDDIVADTVVRQSPDTGTRYAGDLVTLVVSLGPHLVEVPGVFQDGVDSATQTLEDAGFDVETEEASPYFGLGFVVSQTPDGGEMAPYGSTVVITIV